MKGQKISRLRQLVNNCRQECAQQEDIAMGRKPMVAGAFIRRENGACYLSASIKGESRHRYVRKAEQEYWEQRAREWRRYGRAMAGWVKVKKGVEEMLREIGRLRCEELPKGNRKRAKRKAKHGSS